MVNEISTICLVVGLLGLVGAVAVIRRRITRGYSTPIGPVVLVGAFIAAAPFVLIEFDIIEKTVVTVGLASLYFLVFIIGSALTSSKAYQREHEQRLK